MDSAPEQPWKLHMILEVILTTKTILQVHFDNSITNLTFVKCASHEISLSRKLLKIKKGKSKNRF